VNEVSDTCSNEGGETIAQGTDVNCHWPSWCAYWGVC
jgi:hypothetical protein